MVTCFCTRLSKSCVHFTFSMSYTNISLITKTQIWLLAPINIVCYS